MSKTAKRYVMLPGDRRAPFFAVVQVADEYVHQELGPERVEFSGVGAVARALEYVKWRNGQTDSPTVIEQTRAASPYDLEQHERHVAAVKIVL